MKELSVFIDESGDFGAFAEHSPLYLVSLVLHDQAHSISKEVDRLDRQLLSRGFGIGAIHTGPLLRREPPYDSLPVEDRRRLFRMLFNFAYHCDIRFLSVVVEKEPRMDPVRLTARLSSSLSAKLRANEAYFLGFDRIIIYYDNGQTELTKIIMSVFSALFPNVDYRLVSPSDYRLFQVADLVCTVDLTEYKRAKRSLFSASATALFGSAGDFKRNYYKPLRDKEL